jgi:hypothetical protein
VGELPDSLVPSLDVLRRAFPSGISEDEYHALLAAMDGDYSDESLALVVAAATGREPVVVDNDHAAAVTTARPAAADVRRIREQLSSAGYDELAD